MKRRLLTSVLILEVAFIGACIGLMLNRPSLVEQLIRLGPFKARDANPLGGRLVTANQINAVRDYILELEARAVANEAPKR